MRRKNREAKVYTPDQVEAKQDKAVQFLRDVVGDDDRADDIEDMSLQEYADHKKIRMAGNPKGRRRETRDVRRATGHVKRHSLGARNPDGSGAAEMYTVFHGRDPKELFEYQTELESDRDLAALGDLIELDLPEIGKTISFERDRVVLCANPDGTQLFAVGGNQDLSKALDLAPDPSKELIDFGPIRTITYRTRKSFDRFQPTDYVHKLGEEGGEQPRLVYHAPLKHMLFVGGSYSIAAPGPDGVSPGIMN